MDRSLRRAVLERLAAVEDMAVRTGSHLSVRVARSHLKTITSGWRELLIKHQPDLKGRCPVCSGWLRRRRWPCQVWVTAHRHLIGEGSETTKWSAKTSHPFRRPRHVEVIPRQTSAADRTASDQAAADLARVDRADPEQFTAAPPEFGVRDATEDTGEIYTGEIYRAAITEREPTLPRSRRSWRART